MSPVDVALEELGKELDDVNGDDELVVEELDDGVSGDDELVTERLDEEVRDDEIEDELLDCTATLMRLPAASYL